MRCPAGVWIAFDGNLVFVAETQGDGSGVAVKGADIVVRLVFSLDVGAEPCIGCGVAIAVGSAWSRVGL